MENKSDCVYFGGIFIELNLIYFIIFDKIINMVEKDMAETIF